MPTYAHDGLSLWYQESGSGRPVVFLAGTMGDHTQWDVIVPQLRGVRAITPDNRDIGRSSVASRAYTARDMAGDALALLDHLRIERADVVGHSLGGKVAQELALLAPSRVDRLVLVCTSAEHDIASRSLLEHWMRLRQQLTDDLLFVEAICLSAMGPEMLARISLRDAAELWMMKTDLQKPAAFLRNIEASLASEIAGRMGEISALTLVIYSDRDRIFGPEHGERLVAGIRGARGLLMPGCGHAPFAERPAEFAQILNAFLGSGSSPR